MSKKGKKKQVTLVKAFEVALKKRIPYAPIPLFPYRRSDDLKVMRDMSSMSHKALDEIRQVQTFAGLPQRSITKLDHVPGSGIWSDRQVDVYMRFMKWFNQCDKKQRDCTILYIEGYGLREIDRMVRQRNGLACLRIKQGVLDYCFVAGWMKPSIPKEPPPKREERAPIIKPTKVIVFVEA